MIPLDTIRELYEFNYWARDHQLGVCAALSEEQFRRPLGNSFSTVRDTLAHLLWVEWLYLERFQGRSPRALPGPEELPTLAALEERWREVERGLRDYLARLNAQRLASPLSYTNIKGQALSYPLWRILFHLVNHQSYHRGQVTTLLRQLGAQPVAVDYFVFLQAREAPLV